MKIYVSGPMTGKPDFNWPAFATASSLVISHGHDPVLPVPYVEGKKYEDYLRDDLALLLTCDGIYMLEGWRESNGARLEHMIALACGIDEVRL